MPSTVPKIILVSRSFIRRSTDNQLLLIRRSLDDSHNPGLWECPGGKLEQGQDVAGALVREVEEETGLLVRPVNPLVYWESYIIQDSSRYNDLPYITLFGLAEIVNGSLKLSSEHCEYAWTDYDSMLRFDLTRQVRNAATALSELLTK